MNNSDCFGADPDGDAHIADVYRSKRFVLVLFK